MRKKHPESEGEVEGPPRLIRARFDLERVKRQGLDTKRLSEEIKILEQDQDEVNLALLWQSKLDTLVNFDGMLEQGLAAIFRELQRTDLLD